MNQVWDDCVAFIRRERALVIPLAAATILVGDVVATLVQAAARGQGGFALAPIVLLLGAFATVVGQLAITSLVLRPGSSVGEALAHGLRRVPKVVLVALLIGLGAALLITPILAGIRASGVDFADPQTMTRMPGWASLALFVVMLVMLWLAVRLILLNPLIVDRNPGVIEAIKTAFSMTSGMVARIALVLGVYVIVLFVLTNATRFVFGSVFALLGAASGSAFLGSALTALATGLVSTALSTVAIVFIAILYRRTVDSALAPTFR